MGSLTLMVWAHSGLRGTRSRAARQAENALETAVHVLFEGLLSCCIGTFGTGQPIGRQRNCGSVDTSGITYRGRDGVDAINSLLQLPIANTGDEARLKFSGQSTTFETSCSST
jgi:hypothetical protein